MTNTYNIHSKVRNTKDIGKILRKHRKSRGITLERLSGLSNLSPRFLSEFERGKETCEIGKALKALQIMGLEVSVHPRTYKQHPQFTKRSVDRGHE